MSKHKMIASPIKWVGGKRRFRERIVSLIPEHSCYVELFSGAAWVLFGKEPSDVEILNDIDGELVNFFRVVRDSHEDLISAFDWDLVSREEFDRLAGLDTTSLSELERAHRFFYLIMASWGGELNYPRLQTSVSDKGHGNRLIGALKRLRKRIEPVHRRLRTVIIENLDWEACFDRYDKDKVLMYIDPPYPDNKVNYAHNMRSWNEHERLADRLEAAKCKWILSSYDTPEVRALYERHLIIPVESYSGMNTTKAGGSRVKNVEVLVLNFDPPDTAFTNVRTTAAPKKTETQAAQIRMSL